MADLVVISLEPWDDVWRRNQHLVAGLLRTDPGLRVLFVEPAADPTHALASRVRSRRGRGLRPGPRVDGIGAGRLWLHEPTKWLPRRLDKRTDERLVSSVERACSRLELVDPVLWVNAPSGAGLLRRTHWRSLYDVTDDWLSADRTPEEHARLVADEAYLMEHCEELVVCSPQLALTKSSRPLTVVPNAVDLDAFDRDTRRPDDLPAGPVVLYVGTLHEDRLDVPLCVDIAQQLTGRASLVLVGPDALQPGARRRLEASGAVRLGARPFDRVPDYLRAADVLVVPHVVDAFTDSLDPIKVYEYAAARKPVVSTPVAGFRDWSAEHVHVADSTRFVPTLLDVLTAARADIERPSLPSWRDRVEEMRTVLDRLV